jgi:hypothetical protein
MEESKPKVVPVDEVHLKVYQLDFQVEEFFDLLLKELSWRHRLGEDSTYLIIEKDFYECVREMWNRTKKDKKKSWPFYFDDSGEVEIYGLKVIKVDNPKLMFGNMRVTFNWMVG